MSEYEKKLQTLFEEKDSMYDEYSFLLDEVNNKYLSRINLFNIKKKELKIAIFLSITIYIILMLIYFLSRINGLLVPITRYFFLALFLLLIVYYIIVSKKKKKLEKLYQTEMIPIATKLKEVRNKAKDLCDVIYIVIGKLDDPSENDVLILRKKYEAIIKDKVLSNGFINDVNNIDAYYDAVIRYYLDYKAVINGEFSEINRSERALLANRKSNK